MNNKDEKSLIEVILNAILAILPQLIYLISLLYHD